VAVGDRVPVERADDVATDGDRFPAPLDGPVADSGDAVGGRAVDNTGDDDPGRRLEIVRLGDESVDGVETDPQIGVVVRPRVDECRNDAFGERRRNREPDVVAAAGVDNPATAPSRSTSGPPLLPGLAAASVWMTFG